MRTLQEILKNTKYDQTNVEPFLAECYMDYVFFAEHVLGFEIADFHREWYELAEKFKRLSIQAFRGSGKTHFFAGYFLWKAIFEAGTEWLIVSNTLEQAKYVLKIIRNMISENEILKQFIPTQKEGSWKATELNLVNGSIFYCKPYNENIRSIHPNGILCDEAGEYEDKSIFWTAILGTIQLKKGRVIAIGTPKSSVDLLAELKDNEEYMSKEYPAEVNGEVLWKQRYTLNEVDTPKQRSLVKIRREMGELPYTQEYLLIPISSANSLFPYDLTSKGVDDDATFLPFGRKDERYYIGYDMAISPKGDYTVFTVLGVNADRKRIAKAVRVRCSFDEQKVILRKLYDDFKPIRCMVDSTGIGDIPSKELMKEFDNIEPKKFTFDEKYRLLLDLRQEFERFNIVIPNSKEDIATYTYSQQLLQELNDFSLKIDMRDRVRNKIKFNSGKYDDCVISLALANRVSQDVHGQISLRGI